VERITGRAEEITLRRWEDFLSSLSKRFGPLSGKVVFEGIPDVSLQDVGGLRTAKREVESLVLSLIEVPLPDGEEKQEILEIHQRKAEALAGRPLFKPLDFDAITARTAKMSGGDLHEIVQRTLEEKARLDGSGHEPGLVETQDLLRVIEEYRKIKEVVEKIRYGQYL